MYCRKKGCTGIATDGSEYCSQKCKDSVAAEAKAEADRLARDARRDAVSEETGHYLAPNADVGSANIGGGLAKNRQETPAEREARLEADRRLGRADRETNREKARAERLNNQPKPGQNASPPKYGGNGTSRKAKQTHKKRRKQGIR